ncbi:transmembrane amino acid transporter [Toxoplasma gondii MAS]|uniref:Transmembrane amino acid transporter n=1 Tax=Toxoplasma gondii MAS TaxID=943118 RepID=A0A086QKA7_TOXGO|nr:transmembrane amino acid transporter [Toxoplasma gondii MAS]
MGNKGDTAPSSGKVPQRVVTLIRWLGRGAREARRQENKENEGVGREKRSIFLRSATSFLGGGSGHQRNSEIRRSVFGWLSRQHNSGDEEGKQRPPAFERRRKRYLTVSWKYKKSIGMSASFVFVCNQILASGLTSMPLTLIDFGWLPSLLMNLLFCVLSFVCSLLLLESVTLIENNQNFNERFEYSATVRHYLAPMHGARSQKRLHPVTGTGLGPLSGGSEGRDGDSSSTSSPPSTGAVDFPYGPAPLLRRFLRLMANRQGGRESPASGVEAPQPGMGRRAAGAALEADGEQARKPGGVASEDAIVTVASQTPPETLAKVRFSVSSVFRALVSVCNVRRWSLLAVGAATDLYTRVVRGVHGIITTAPPLLPPSFPRTFTMLLHLNTFLSTCSAALLVAYCLDCLFLRIFSFTLFLPLLPTDVSPFLSVCGAVEWLGALSALLLRPLFVFFDAFVSLLFLLLSLVGGPVSTVASWFPSFDPQASFALFFSDGLSEAQDALDASWMSLSRLFSAVTNALCLPLGFLPETVSSLLSAFPLTLPRAFAIGYSRGSAPQPFAVPALPFLYALPSQHQIEEVFSGVCTPNCDGEEPTTSSLLPAVVTAFFRPRTADAQGHSDAALSDLAAAAAGSTLGQSSGVCTPCVGHMGITLGYVVTAGICLHLAAADLQDNMQLQFLSFGAIIAAVFQITASAALVLLRVSSASALSSLFPSAASSPLASASPSSDATRAVHIPGTCAVAPRIPGTFAGTEVCGRADQMLNQVDTRFSHSETLANGKLEGSFLASPWPSAIVRGSGIGSLVSTFVDAYSFSNALPSWANEIKDDVPVTRTILTSTAFSCAVYFFFGYLCAAAFPAPSASSNVIAAMLPSSPSFVAVACICFFHVFALLPNIVTGQISCRYDLINMAICMDKQSAFFTASKLPWLLYWLLTFSPVFALPSSLLTLSTNVLLNFAAPAVVFIYALHACADAGDFFEDERELLSESGDCGLSVVLSRDRKRGSASSGETDVHGFSPSPDSAFETSPHHASPLFSARVSPSLSSPRHASRLLGDSLSTTASTGSVSPDSCGLKSCLKPGTGGPGLRAQGRKKTVVARIDAASSTPRAGNDDGLHRLRMEAAEAGSRHESRNSSGALGSDGFSSVEAEAGEWGDSTPGLKRSHTQDVTRLATTARVGSGSLELRSRPTHANLANVGNAGGMARVSGAVAGGGCARSREVQRQLHEWLQEYSRQLPDSEVALLLQRQEQEEEDEQRRLQEDEDEDAKNRCQQLGNAWLRRQALGDPSGSEEEGDLRETEQNGEKEAQAQAPEKEMAESDRTIEEEGRRRPAGDGNSEAEEANEEAPGALLAPLNKEEQTRSDGVEAPGNENDRENEVNLSRSSKRSHVSFGRVSFDSTDTREKTTQCGDGNQDEKEEWQAPTSSLLDHSTEDKCSQYGASESLEGDKTQGDKAEKEALKTETDSPPAALTPGEIPVEFAAAEDASRFVRRQGRTRRVDSASLALQARQRAKEQQRAADRSAEETLGGEQADQKETSAGATEDRKQAEDVRVPSGAASANGFSSLLISPSTDEVSSPADEAPPSTAEKVPPSTAQEISSPDCVHGGPAATPALLAPGEILEEFAPASAASTFVRRTARSARIDSVAVALQNKKAERQRRLARERRNRNDDSELVGDSQAGEAGSSDRRLGEVAEAQTHDPISSSLFHPSPSSSSVSLSSPHSSSLLSLSLATSSASAESRGVEAAAPSAGDRDTSKDRGGEGPKAGPQGVGSVSGSPRCSREASAAPSAFAKHDSDAVSARHISLWHSLHRATTRFRCSSLLSLWSWGVNGESRGSRDPPQSLLRQCTSRLQTLRIPGASCFSKSQRRVSTSTCATSEEGPRVVVFAWLPTVEQKLVATYVLLLVICFCAIVALAEDTHAFLEAFVVFLSTTAVSLFRLLRGGVCGTAWKGLYACIGLVSSVVPSPVAAVVSDLVASAVASLEGAGAAVEMFIRVSVPTLARRAVASAEALVVGAQEQAGGTFVARTLGSIWRLRSFLWAAVHFEETVIDRQASPSAATNGGASQVAPVSDDFHALDAGEDDGLWSFEAFFLSLLCLLLTAIPLFLYVSPARQRERRRNRCMQRQASDSPPFLRCPDSDA